MTSSFLTLPPGTPVLDRFGLSVGHVERVLVASGCYFDGILVETAVGRRFVDAPEVREIEASVVLLATAKHDVEHPGEPRVLGAPSARHGRTDVLPEDREAVIAAFKHAYVRDLVDTEQLGRGVEQAHTVQTLDALEALVPGALKAPVAQPE